MKDFTFFIPTRLIVGRMAENETGKWIKEYGGHKVLVHYGSSYSKRSGLVDRVIESIHSQGIETVELGGVVPNPRLSLVYTGIELGKREGVDFVLAVGGGSVIDSAKAIALGLSYDGDVWDYYADKDSPSAAVRDEPCTPVGVVLTNAAAGSECSQSSVITREEGQLKRDANSFYIRPVFAIENPELSISLPVFQTACGIVDIMAHSMERYFIDESTGNELSDRLCEAIFLTCMDCAAKLMYNPSDYNSRASIMVASSLSHNGLTDIGRTAAGDWSSHYIEHELSGEYDIAHGAGLAVIIPAWMKYVFRDNMTIFIKWATRVMGVRYDYDRAEITVQEAIRRLEEFYHSIGLPTRLRDVPGIGDVSEEIMYKMAKRVKTVNNDGTLGVLKKLGTEDIINIYKLAL